MVRTVNMSQFKSKMRQIQNKTERELRQIQRDTERKMKNDRKKEETEGRHILRFFYSRNAYLTYMPVGTGEN